MYRRGGTENIMYKASSTNRLRQNRRTNHGSLGISTKIKLRQYICSPFEFLDVNPLRPNSDLSQTSHCNIKGLSVSEVVRT